MISLIDKSLLEEPKVWGSVWEERLLEVTFKAFVFHKREVVFVCGAMMMKSFNILWYVTQYRNPMNESERLIKLMCQT